ncbi:MAG: hypothetical protein NXI01_05905 [Gammaproteobacteria bacterium]|nr:hypothetical protein [Gammaproteobacteria bacterium]
MQDLRDKGFFYSDAEDLKREFKLAETYFQNHPNEIKIRREQWRKMMPDHPPKHSYMNFGAGKIIAFATKARRRDAEHRIGYGTFGYVKYGLDQEGKIYGIKIEKTNTESQQKETQISRDRDVMVADKQIRSTDGREKYYSALVYLGDSLDKRLRYGPAFTLAQKNNIARKIAWQLHQFHTGKGALSGQGYAHFDLKPDNVVIDDKGQVRLIDYGFAQLVTAPIVDHTGSAYYLPTIQGQQYHEAMQQEDRSLTDQIAGDILRQMQALGPEGTDVFAFKRTLYSAEPDKSQDACLFTDGEYAQLPEALQTLIKTGSSQNPADFEHAVQQHHTALDMVYGMLAPQLSAVLKEEIQTTAQKELIGGLFAHLDELEAWMQVDPGLKAEMLARYQARIAQAQKWSDIVDLEKELGQMTQCLAQMMLIDSAQFGMEDVQMQQFIREHSGRLYRGEDVQETLSQALRAVQSEEYLRVQGVLTELSDKVQDIDLGLGRRPLFGSSQGLQEKISTIESALIQIPILERGHILSDATNPHSVVVQSECRKRYYGMYKGIRLPDSNAESSQITAKFRRFKALLRPESDSDSENKENIGNISKH